jgi:hypothetical protein
MRRMFFVGLAVASLVLASAAPVGAARTSRIDGLKISPAIGQFARIQIGTCNPGTDEGCKIISFTLRNVGKAPIYFGGFAIHTPTSDFGFANAILKDDCVLLPLGQVNGQPYLTLVPGDSCQLGVLFAPTSEGRIERRWDAFFDNQFEPILIVPLRGFGVA